MVRRDRQRQHDSRLLTGGEVIEVASHDNIITIRNDHVLHLELEIQHLAKNAVAPSVAAFFLVQLCLQACSNG